jgi:hypothetical protein
MEVVMNHIEDDRDQDLIDLGAASVETKGVSNSPRIDTLGNHSMGGISDD